MDLPQNQTEVNVNILLKFIQETKEGKFTEQVPTMVQVSYQRMEIQEQINPSEQDKNEVILFGVS